MIAVVMVCHYFFFKANENITEDDVESLSTTAKRGTATSSIQSTHCETQECTDPNFPGPLGRIAFRLHELDDMTINPTEIYDPGQNKCQHTAGLPAPLAQRGVLDFKVSISTDLKVLFIGDSIGSQLAQAFDAAVLEPAHDYRNLSIKSLFYYMPERFPHPHICVSKSSPIRGGGVSAFMRHNYMLSSSNLERYGKCGHGSKIWGLDVVYSLLETGHRVNNTGHRVNSTDTRVGGFNAAILKIPALSWIKNIHSVTKEAIIEEVNLVAEHFGAEIVIISTLSFSNNVKTLGDWQGIQQVNEMIRQIAKQWAPSTTELNYPRWILVQELGAFTNEMIWTNAKHIGYNVSLNFSIEGWEGVDSEFLLDRFEKRSRFNWPPSKPMVCATKPNGTKIGSCEQNKISPDGTHWCTPVVGPRYSASIACLLGCVYNEGLSYVAGVESPNPNINMTIRICEEECNQRFMSLKPVNTEWIDAGETLYTRSSR